MKPELPSSIPMPEKRIDRSVDMLIPPERVDLNNHERLEKKSEVASSVVEKSGGAVFSIPILPTQNVVSDGNNTTFSNPVVAADEDLIEKEWVDRAKKIIKDTKNDPYQQEKEINVLRSDYINKRYRGGGRNAA